jgi:hypothetical protein
LKCNDLAIPKIFTKLKLNIRDIAYAESENGFYLPGRGRDPF